MACIQRQGFTPALSKDQRNRLIYSIAFRSNEYTASKAYGIAAILTPMMIPFTFMFITSTNAQLNRLASIAADDVAKVDKTEVRRLIQRWKVLNYRRTFLVFIASGFGLLGTLAWRL